MEMDMGDYEDDINNNNNAQPATAADDAPALRSASDSEVVSVVLCVAPDIHKCVHMYHVSVSVSV
jgi:hypothetical protein